MLKLDFPEMEFSLYFMGYEKAEDVPSDPKERAKFCFSRKATLELTQSVIFFFLNPLHYIITTDPGPYLINIIRCTEIA